MLWPSSIKGRDMLGVTGRRATCLEEGGPEKGTKRISGASLPKTIYDKLGRWRCPMSLGEVP